jgi:hypothetical protein
LTKGEKKDSKCGNLGSEYFGKNNIIIENNNKLK